MSEMNFGQMLDEEFVNIRTGQVVEGTVYEVNDERAIVTFGAKSEGILTKQEYSNDPKAVLTEALKPGDSIRVKVLRLNDGDGMMVLSSKRLLSEKVNERLKEACENKEIVTGTVTEVRTGGLSVICEGSRVFIPASLVSDIFERDLKKFEGQEVSFVITECEPKRNRIIGDRKQVVAEEKAKAREELLSKIAEGDVVEGTVKNVTDFGAFIDLGGADGLLHISEMSWGRVDNPKNLLKVGDKIKVLIKKIDDSKIALSCKFADTNPWATAEEKYAEGNVVEGRIARMTNFGAFVELEPGVDALLHVSQISRERVEKPSDVLSINQIVQVEIVKFDSETKRISLSMKSLEPKKEDAAPEEAAE